MIVATAGHIDHGKTTLVKVLTGIDTDRLPEEKARGISIDLGFAHWKVPGAGIVGFVDVPGHERFVRNMVAGVCGIDYAMLVVAADDGIMPQTREHLNILNLLAVRSGIAVITKVDRVSADRVTAVRAEMAALLDDTWLAGAALLPVSAITGHGMEHLRDAISQDAIRLRRQAEQGRLFRFAIDRAFTVSGTGTVVTGTIFTGTVSVRDKLLQSPRGTVIRVRGIQAHGEPMQSATAGQRCALHLGGVQLGEIQRGDWLLTPTLHAPSQRLDVHVQVLKGERHSLRHWTPIHVHLGTRDVTARVVLRRHSEIPPGECGDAQLIANSPMVALHGDRFILRDQSALRTIGGGVVLYPWAVPYKGAASHQTRRLEALRNNDAGKALRALIECTPSGVDLNSFSRAFSLDEFSTAELLRDNEFVRLGKNQAGVIMARTTLETIQRSIDLALTRFHHTYPQSIGMDLSSLHIECAPELTPPVFENVVRSMALSRQVQLTSSLVHSLCHRSTQNPADERLWSVLHPVFVDAGLVGANIDRLSAATNLDHSLVRDFLHRKAQTGALVRLTSELFYLRSTMAAFAAIATSLANAAPNGRFTVAQFRDRAGIGRVLAIKVLEGLDRLMITRRLDNERMLLRDFAVILGPAPSTSRETR